MTSEEKPAAPEAASAVVSSSVSDTAAGSSVADSSADPSPAPSRHTRSRASRSTGRRTSRGRGSSRSESPADKAPVISEEQAFPPVSAELPASQSAPRSAATSSRAGGRSRSARKSRPASAAEAPAGDGASETLTVEVPSFISSVETGASVQQEAVLRDMEQQLTSAFGRKRRSSRRSRKSVAPAAVSASAAAAATPDFAAAAPVMPAETAPVAAGDGSVAERNPLPSLALMQADLTPPAPAGERAPVLVTPELKALVPVEAAPVALMSKADNAAAGNDIPAEHAEPAGDGIEESSETSEAGAVPSGEEEGPRRKSRRGRRGGRGRSRKNRQLVEESAAPAPEEEETTSLAEIFAEPEDADEDELCDQEDVDEDEAASSEEGASESAKKGGIRAAAIKAKAAAASGRQRMFISVLPGEQVEVALAEEGVLLEYYLDMLHQKKLKGNIYKGVIHNIDTNLQAAFVSYGAGKNGFLQIDEVHPEYWLTHHEPAKGKKYPPIQKVLKAGQEVLVQVVKEPNGSKGAFLTTWLSLAGRFLVLTPGQEQIGVSRKVDSDEERARLREMMNGIEPGEGLGVIVRTVSAGVTKSTLKSDLQYLKRVWRDIRKRATEVTAPALVHEEPGLPERAVRDYLTDEVCEIWVDNEELSNTIRETVSQLFPRKKDLVRLHSDPRHSMWERFNLRRQLDQIYSREVTMPSGGRLVFDQTEALMAVDINSGKISGKANFESMAFRTNVEAAETIARQLRLRDIGGQVVIDFIEMRDRKHVAEVEKTLRLAMKSDRARHDVGRMSSFGLLELVRQRMGSSALAISMEPCPHCNGTGQRRNREWQALQALRDLRSLLRSQSGDKIAFETTAEVGMYLLNHKRDTLRDLENSFGKSIEICLRP